LGTSATISIIISGYIERASKRNVGAVFNREFKCRGWKPLPLKFLQLIIKEDRVKDPFEFIELL